MLATVKTKKTELLFLSLFLRSLATGGRCASIVPDGVLTGTSNAHKAIRKAIIDGNRLEAVVSMPSEYSNHTQCIYRYLDFHENRSGRHR